MVLKFDPGPITQWIKPRAPILCACCGALMTIVADDCGRHDTVGGACSKESNTLRSGYHTRHQHACVENFLATDRQLKEVRLVFFRAQDADIFLANQKFSE